MNIIPLQSINRRRYLQKDIDEGIEYLRHGTIPNRLDHNPTRQTAFQRKWSAGTVQNNNKIIIGGREVVPVEQVHKILNSSVIMVQNLALGNSIIIWNE